MFASICESTERERTIHILIINFLCKFKTLKELILLNSKTKEHDLGIITMVSFY